MFTSFLHSEVLGTLCTFFQRYYTGSFHFFCHAKSTKTFYFLLRIKILNDRGGYKTDNMNFLILVDERFKGTKVFMINEL